MRAAEKQTDILKNPAAPTPKTRAVPVHYDREEFRGEKGEEDRYFDSDDLEEFPDSDFEDQDLERFEDEKSWQDEYKEVREPEPDEGERELLTRPPSQEPISETSTQVALRNSSASQTVEESPAQPAATQPTNYTPSAEELETKWRAQFYVTGDSDDFEEDSSDEFEYLD